MESRTHERGTAMRTMYKGSRYTDGYKLIMHEARMGDWDDPYGEVMSHLFGLATVAYVEYGEVLPEFRPSPCLESGSHERLEGYPDTMYQDYVQSRQVTLEDIRNAYRVFSRYYDMVPEDRKY